ncbi:MAG: hydroxysqualene dehydroxylase HpnE [Planctomycetaceae bacterium]|nr:hydroxysqualene dehydroxylase HpnE [Planctomycetaceae bacterium]MCB9949701.1 FAD-dependent oxidoreductase [Planctomycetaceae bacterium]
MTREADVVVVGGGLAGMAAAVRLAEASRRVTLVESRKRLGGRASSFVDATSGDAVDNCQHVAMGCCTEFLDFCQRTHTLQFFARETELKFRAPETSTYKFAATFLPAPLHLSWAFARLPFLTLSEKLRFAHGVYSLWKTSPDKLRGIPFDQWLADHHQPDRVIRRAWELLLVSALSESMDRIDTSYARKVLVDGFISTRHGWEVYRPLRPLDEIFTHHIAGYLESKGVRLLYGDAVQELEWSEAGITSAKLSSGQQVSGQQFVVAVPWHRLGGILGDQLVERCGLQQLEQIESAPITSVHLWTSAPILDSPHLVLVDCLGHWVFEHPAAEDGGEQHCYQVVISASRQLKQQSNSETIAAVWKELQQLLPKGAAAELQHARVVTEHRAVFSPLPGIDELRPQQQTLIPNLQIAGDWTQTGWPATMESAVRSGYLAAENILGQGP